MERKYGANYCWSINENITFSWTLRNSDADLCQILRKNIMNTWNSDWKVIHLWFVGLWNENSIFFLSQCWLRRGIKGKLFCFCFFGRVDLEGFLQIHYKNTDDGWGRWMDVLWLFGYSTAFQTVSEFLTTRNQNLYFSFSQGVLEEVKIIHIHAYPRKLKFNIKMRKLYA